MIRPVRPSILLLLLALPLSAGGASALVRAPLVGVSMTTSPRLTLDSNKPCTEGPRAAYVGFRVTNQAGVELRDLRAAISGFSGGIALQGGQAAEQFIGRLAPGASRDLYWFVSYPCTIGISSTLTVAVTDATPGSATGSGTVATASMVSAQAGGVLVSGLLGPGAVVGQTIPFDVTYDFGGADVGTTYNLQPAGNTSFDAGCFQLTGSLVTASTVTAIPAGSTNQLFYTATQRQAGSGYQVTVRYYFKYLCAGVSSVVRPYSNQLSGTQLKYSSNYETFIGPTLPGATIGFAVSKSVTPDSLPLGGTATYTVAIRNTSPFTADLDSIADVLPAGVAYTGLAAGSGVTASNSGSVPAPLSTGTLKWRGPWTVPAGGTLNLVYTTQIPATPGSYVNTAGGYSGITLLGSSQATVHTGPIYGVAVSPQGLGAALARVPGSGYGQAYSVTNRSNVAESFDLLGRVANAGGGMFTTVDSLTGTGVVRGARPDSARVLLAVSQAATVTVWYTVAQGGPAQDSLLLRARSVARPAVSAQGWVELRRVAPAMTLAKLVSPGGTVLPGTDLTYTIQIQNAGEAEAHQVVVVDSLPAALQFRVGSEQRTLPSGVTASVTYSADGASWSLVPASGGCGAPTGYDACVRMIRWTLAGTLPADLVQSAGTLRFLARVR